MSQLVMAQRGFQASVQVTKDAQETYASALSDREGLRMSVAGSKASATAGFTPYVAPSVGGHRRSPVPVGTGVAGERRPRTSATSCSTASTSSSGCRTHSDQLAVKAATGDLNAIHDYTIAATEAR